MFRFHKVLIISVLGLLMLIISCNGSQTNSSENATTEVAAAPKATLPVPETAFLTDIFERVDYIDFVFDKTNFSISVTDKANAQRNVTYLTQSAVEDVNCTPYMGRMYFNSEGVGMATAQIHYDDACKYFIFVDSKQRPKSACVMSDAGLAFFENIFKQVKMTPQ